MTQPQWTVICTGQMSVEMIGIPYFSRIFPATAYASASAAAWTSTRGCS